MKSTLQSGTGSPRGSRAFPHFCILTFNIFLLTFLLSSAAVRAQSPALPPSDSAHPPLLTPQQAVRIGLEKNHSLSLARDQAAAAEINRKAGIGPFLPEVSADARHAGVIGEGEGRTSLGASAGLLIFDGFQSYHGYRRLKSQEEAAGLEERQAVETTLEAILSAYYSIVQQQRRLVAIRELLAVSEERARLAQARMEVGAGSRLEQLQALSDLNTDSSAFLGQQVALREAKLELNRLLARDPAEEFEVQDSIPLESGLPLEAWRSGLGENNTAIRQARAARRAAASGLKEARGGYWPDVNAGLGYSTTPDALAGNDPLLRDEDGVTYSLSLSVPLFDRFRARRDVGNARLALRQDETRLRQRELEVAGQFERALRRHVSGLRQVALEERNLEVSRLQAEAARERFRLGASSPLEFRDAQTRLLDSQSRLAAIRQETKAAELALKRLAGALVKEAG